MFKKIRVGGKYIEAVSIKLLSKNFILLRGRKGFVMCGYLDLRTAQKFGDIAIKIVGVSTIKESLETKVHSCSFAAKKLGIHRNQPIKEVIAMIA